jgi:hypothetical protein
MISQRTIFKYDTKRRRILNLPRASDSYNDDLGQDDSLKEGI